MDYRSLGHTGLKVSPLCLGCMMFGPRGNDDHQDCIRIIHRAIDAGINFLDTANVYSDGISEEIVGKALLGRRDEVVLATKVHGEMGPGPNQRGNGRKHIMWQVEQSLRRLQTDYIDLYQIHRPDPSTPIEETLRALDDLVHQGKVRFIGSSTFAAWQLVESYWVSDTHNLARFVCEQPPYSILSRGIEREVLPACQAYGTGVIPWSPLHRGYLSGALPPRPAAGRGVPRQPRSLLRPAGGCLGPAEAGDRGGADPDGRGAGGDAGPVRARLDPGQPHDHRPDYRAARDGATGERAERARYPHPGRTSGADRHAGTARHRPLRDTA